MEHPAPHRQPLSPQGERRLRIASAVHREVRVHCFRNHNRHVAILKNRKGFDIFHLPRIEQILDFVREFTMHNMNDGNKELWAQVAIPELHRSHHHYVCVLPLPKEINEDFEIIGEE